MSTVTKEEVKAALSAVMVIANAIKERESVPNGRLYAEVMGSLSLESYTKVLDLLKRSGLVSENNHLLTWVGPK